MSANAQADEQVIRQLIDDWMQATARGDAAKVLSLMSDDVVFMTAGREPFGKKEFAAQSEGLNDVKLEGVAKPVGVHPVDAAVVAPVKTSAGLWPSDHLGYFATLHLR